MKTISIVRNRGQLTIPDSVRKMLSWLQPLSAVSISIANDEKIIIQPHRKATDWENIWKNITASRKLEGKKAVSTADFLEQDRASH